MNVQWQLDRRSAADPLCQACGGNGYVVFACGTPWSCSCTKRHPLLDRRPLSNMRLPGAQKFRERLETYENYPSNGRVLYS